MYRGKGEGIGKEERREVGDGGRGWEGLVVRMVGEGGDPTTSEDLQFES